MRALVLSGGGSKGAFQAGALELVAGNQYDIFAGISVGAINATYLQQFRPLATGVYGLADMWRRIETKTVYKKWFGGVAAAIWKPSVYNTAPLRQMISENITHEKVKGSGKLLRIAAVSVPDGDYKVWTEQSSDIVNGVMASSAFPAMLTPVQAGDKLYLDGGLRTVTPIGDAIAAGATQIDVILCSPPKNLKRSFDKNVKTLGLAKSSLSIILDEMVEKDLKLAHLYNQLANVKADTQTNKQKVEIRILRPSRDLGDPLDFSREKNLKTMAQGARDMSKFGFQTLSAEYGWGV